jgi:phosphoadenosine phosphosulfate reductase
MTQTPKPLTQPTTLDLRKLNQKFEKSHPKDILSWCVINMPTGLVQVSPFGVDDMLITDLLYRALKPSPRVPVLFANTLHHFQETLEVVAHAKLIYNLKLKICRIKDVSTREAFAEQYGAALWEKDTHLFTQLTHTEPLQRGLAELDAIAWITGDRRDQANDLGDMPIFELDQKQRLKVNPLAHWTRKETWAYVFEHDVIFNPLYDQGYANIGDEPLTTPIGEGEPEMAGH